MASKTSSKEKNGIKKEVKKAVEQVEQLKDKMRNKFEDLILNKFPKKIIELDKMINGDKFKPIIQLQTEEVNILVPEVNHEDAQSKSKSENFPQKTYASKPIKYDSDDDEEEDFLDLINKPFLFPNGMIKPNNHLLELINILKPLMIDLVDELDVIKLGLSLLMPKIEDGNNLGIEIQEETLSQVHDVEDDIQTSFDSFSSYYQTRGEIMIKVAKYPHSQDYRRALRENDEKFYLSLCIALSDIRKHYVSLHDLVVKNLNKIKKPKSNDNYEYLY